MSNKIKSSLYFACFFIAAMTYYNANQADAEQLAMEKEITKIENSTVGIEIATDLNELQ